MTHDDFMKEALKEAQLAYDKNEIPIGAIIVHDGNIIARAHNLRQHAQTTDAHAEMLAIKQANAAIGSWRLENCTLYTTLEPCMMCAGAIVQSRMSTVVFGATDEKAGCSGTIINLLAEPRFNHQCHIISGVCADESRTLLTTFFKQLRASKT